METDDQNADHLVVAAQRHSPERLGLVFEDRIEDTVEFSTSGRIAGSPVSAISPVKPITDRHGESGVEFQSDDCFRTQQVIAVAQQDHSDGGFESLRGDAKDLVEQNVQVAGREFGVEDGEQGG